MLNTMPCRPALTWMLALGLIAGTLFSGCAGSGHTGDASTASLVSIPQASDLAPPSKLADRLEEALMGASEDSPSMVSPRVLDQYLAKAFPNDVDSMLLWRSYREMLGSAPAYTGDTLRAHLEQHLILSELLYQDVAPRTGTLSERADFALKWWMEQETAPAAGVHERLVVHLERIAEARTRYPSARRESGLDERGETFVRLGAPSRTRTVEFNEAELMQSFFRDGLPVRLRDFPGNEVWIYDHLGQMGMFLFVEGRRGGDYRLGSVNDLVPRQLRSRGVSGSARGTPYAIAGLRTLRYVFSQLALFHPAYSARYTAISDYVGWQEERTITQRAGGRQPTPIAGYGAPTQTLGAALSRNERDDATLESRRAATVPREYASVDIPRLDVRLRAMRVLAPNGSTMVNVFWEFDADDVIPCIRATGDPITEGRMRIMAYGPGYASSDLLHDSSAPTPEFMGLQRHVLELADSVEALALQVDAHLGSYVGACSGVSRTDSIEPLSFGAMQFAASDLLPFRVADVVETQHQLARGFSVGDLEPHLSGSLDGEEALGVYFEVYASTDLEDDYEIQYQLARRTHAGFLQRGRTHTSVFQSGRPAMQHRLPAAFLIDKAEWAGADEVDVIVTVTNLQTGHELSRQISFATHD